MGERRPALNEGFCLVLSGGGAKGVYHIGVWRALRELGIEVECFVGTSIGAIIAALLAQGSDELLEELGQSLRVENVLELPEEFIKDGRLSLDRISRAALHELFANIVENKGLGTSPMRKLIASKIDEKKIRALGKDLGIVTVNISDLQPREIFLEDIENGKLVEYLLASAAFPGLERPVIKGKSYLDGGVHDNVPYEMARRRGYRKIIVSDMAGIGRSRSPDVEGSLTVYIKNSVEMGGAFDFDPEFRKTFTELGYLDTLRVFGKLVGYSYFLRPDAAADAVAHAAAEAVAHAAAEASAKAAFAADPAGNPAAMPPPPEKMLHDRRRLLVSLECAATILGVERVRIYDYGELAAAILERRKTVDERLEAIRNRERGGLLGMAPAISAAISSGSFSECPYFYHRFVRDVFPGPTGGFLHKAIEALCPELPVGLAWLDSRQASSKLVGGP